MDLTYKRKLPQSRGNKAAVIAIPRAVTQAWEQYNAIKLIFDGNRLVIQPIDDGKKTESAGLEVN